MYRGVVTGRLQSVAPVGNWTESTKTGVKGGRIRVDGGGRMGWPPGDSRTDNSETGRSERSTFEPSPKNGPT
ncbi:MAG: hypothetical protein NTY18_10325 [Deltaproteobacteria bacterium]|nr:hypothetical protein [Deltaproteobacteria bacterium]